MANIPRHGLVKCDHLSMFDRDAVRALAIACNDHDGLDLPLQWEPDGAVPGDGPANRLLFFERDALIGFASIQGGGGIEVYGMVHPAHRRRGVGRALLEAAKAECQLRGEHELIVATEERSESGKGFVEAMGGRFRFAEYMLELDANAVDRSRPREPALRLQRASTNESEVIAEITAAATGDPLEEKLKAVEQGMMEAHQRYFLARLHDEPVGTLRVSEHPPHTYITAFAVRPDFQGRGFGRQMLLETIARLLAEGRQHIRIEVETDNRNALGLYESCGFRATTAYLYYQIACEQGL